MPNPYGVPEISVSEVARKRVDGDTFVLLDVREPMELMRANLGEGIELAPMSELAARRLDALPESMADKDVEVVVFCHTGIRSAQVTAWLRQEGWIKVLNMAGGIEAYAIQVDPSVGRY